MPIALTVLMALVLGPPAIAAAYETGDLREAGTLTGIVRFAGVLPALAPVPVKKNRDVCGSEKPPAALVVGPERGVQDAVILIEGVTRGKPPAGELVLDNRHCLFSPRVGAVMAGSPAKVKNSDPILHNTHGLLDGVTLFNLALPLQNQVIDVTRRLKRPGVIRVLCDAHTHMLAWIVVHDSPYFAVTDEQGRFRIDGVPPGRYRVTMWHEGFAPRGFDKDGRPLFDEPRRASRTVTVPPRGTVALEFTLE